jgi:hypothetical protein
MPWVCAEFIEGYDSLRRSWEPTEAKLAQEPFEEFEFLLELVFKRG